MELEPTPQVSSRKAIQSTPLGQCLHLDPGRDHSYAGEITLWAGLPLIALPTLLANANSAIPLTSRLPGYFPYLAFVPPVFEYLLLNYGSGVPLLEKSAEKKWGADKGPGSWAEYKSKVPVLFSLPGSKI